MCRLALAGAALVACAQEPAPGRSRPPLAVGAEPGPPGPSAGLPMPSLDLEWSPPILVAGDVDALAQSVAALRPTAVVIGRGVTAPPARLTALGAHLGAPAAATIEASGAPLEGLVAPRRTEGSGARRPRYEAAGVRLGAGAGAATGQSALVIDVAVVDAGQWSALWAYAVGGCEAPLAALAVGQERSLAVVEPFLDHADAELWRAYRAALAGRVPGLVELLAADAEALPRERFADDLSHRRHRCAHAYAQIVAAYAACGEEAETCPVRPRLFLGEGARIGAPEPDVFVAAECAGLVGRDPVAELRRAGRDATHVAAEGLSAEWSILADRVAAIGEVADVLEDICVPRRWRFEAGDLAAARRRLAAVGAALASPDMALREGAWVIEDSVFHVPGLGGVRQLARFAAGRGSVNQEARVGVRRLRDLILGRARCRGRSEAPMVAAVTDASGAAAFVGYFHEEELLCGDLPPFFTGGASAGPVSGG